MSTRAFWWNDEVSLGRLITEWAALKGPEELLSATAFIEWADTKGQVAAKDLSGREGMTRAINAAMRKHPALRQIDVGNRTTTFKLRQTETAASST